MEQRELRKNIFGIFFEYEIMKNDVKIREKEFLDDNKLSKSKKEFFENYIKNYIENEEKVIEIIKQNLVNWTFERLGVVERVLLKMAFYEIAIKDQGHEIVINETLEISKIYGDTKTSKFINGILANYIKTLQ